MKYDAIIVGASIAGLYTGMKLSQSGWTVAIFDRRKEIGMPVRCGEATGSREELSRFVKVTDDMIACEVKGMKIYCRDFSPFRIEMPGRSVILHRDRLEKTLAAIAQTSGARIFLQTSVIGLQGGLEGGYNGVITDACGVVEGRYIIGADGCESKVGQWAGITGFLKPGEAFTSVQYLLQTQRYHDGYLHFFAGPEYIPSGYMWVFPKTSGRVLVGAGLYGFRPQGKRASDYLNRFIEIQFPGAVRLDCITGCVPLAVCPKRLHRANVVVVGDAARQANPLTAGGIMNTFEAADCLVQTLVPGRSPAHYVPGLNAYSRKWAKQRFNQKVFYFVKEVFLGMSAQRLTAAVSKVQKAARGRSISNKPFSFSLPLLLRLGLIIGPELIAHVRRARPATDTGAARAF